MNARGSSGRWRMRGNTLRRQRPSAQPRCARFDAQGRICRTFNRAPKTRQWLRTTSRLRKQRGRPVSNPDAHLHRLGAIRQQRLRGAVVQRLADVTRYT
jgi:hypothetical protein